MITWPNVLGSKQKLDLKSMHCMYLRTSNTIPLNPMTNLVTRVNVQLFYVSF